jgi:hypothetical protein
MYESKVGQLIAERDVLDLLINDIKPQKNLNRKTLKNLFLSLPSLPSRGQSYKVFPINYAGPAGGKRKTNRKRRKAKKTRKQRKAKNARKNKTMRR